MIPTKLSPAQNNPHQTLRTTFRHKNDSVSLHNHQDLSQQNLAQYDEERKEQASIFTLTQKPQTQAFTFLSSSDDISLKKLVQLSRPKNRTNSICYISDKNLLLLILTDSRTIHIYSTTNFNLVQVKRSQHPVSCLHYSKDLNKILVGGSESVLQIWDPINFQVEASSPHPEHHKPLSLTYIPQPNVIAVKTYNKVSIYNTELKSIANFSLPDEHEERTNHNQWSARHEVKCSRFFGGLYVEAKTPRTASFYELTPELFLVVCAFPNQKKLYLINLKEKTLKEC